MRFSVVDTGYDPRQVDSCLDDLGVRLTRLAARAERAGGADREWDLIRQEATGLLGLLRRLEAGEGRRGPGELEREAAEILARARFELDAAREEARQLREQAYADALRARREFEAALQARRRREARADEVLGGLRVEPVPPDTPTAAAAVTGSGVPATRAAAGGEPDAAGRDARVR
ncbi:ATPase [Micromonospora sp. LZ34]